VLIKKNKNETGTNSGQLYFLIFKICFMITRKKMTSLLIFFFLGIAGLFAQLPQQPQQPQQQPEATDVSDGEMEQFAAVFSEMQSLDQAIQQKMMGALQEEGIAAERFNEIMKAQQDPNEEVDASQEELEQFAAASQAIQKIQQDVQEDMQKIILDNDLTVERYQEIMMAVRSDPELQQALQSLMEDMEEE
jgi:hypothetical protein